MKRSGFATFVWFKRLLVFALAALALYWYVGTVRERIRADSFAGVDLTGVHHLGPAFNVAGFYVDGYYGSNVGRGGGGGSNVCCVMLPKKWRPGLSVEVRWSVNDWSHEKPAEVAAGNYDSVAEGGSYIARVPVERYEVAEHVWVHFFAGGKARVVSSMAGSGGPTHPIQDEDPHAVDSATAGKPVEALFSPEELAAMQRRAEDRREKYGDWR
jgi:hypothetical protein